MRNKLIGAVAGAAVLGAVFIGGTQFDGTKTAQPVSAATVIDTIDLPYTQPACLTLPALLPVFNFVLEANGQQLTLVQNYPSPCTITLTTYP